MVNEMEELIRSFRIPEMFVLTDGRLDLNTTLADQHRRVFTTSQRTMEFSMVVIEDDQHNRHEGIKFKINNEANSTMLTLQEFMSFYMCLKQTNVDAVAMLLYMDFMKNRNTIVTMPSPIPTIDIIPKSSPMVPYQSPSPVASDVSILTSTIPTTSAEIGSELPF